MTCSAASSVNVLNSSSNIVVVVDVLEVSSSIDRSLNAFIISAIFKVGRALVSAPQITSRKSESETVAFFVIGSFLGEVVVVVVEEEDVAVGFSTTTFFPAEVVVTGGGMKESNAFKNRFLRPSTHSFSSATGVLDEDDGVVVADEDEGFASDFLEVVVVVGAPNPNPENILSNAFEVRSSASEINVSASSTASIPLMNPRELKNPPLFFGGDVETLSAMAMASSASAITESNSDRNSVFWAMDRKLDSCSVLLGCCCCCCSCDDDSELDLAPKRPPNNPPPPPPLLVLLLLLLISISFLRCSRFRCRSALRPSFVRPADDDDDADDEDNVTVGKVGVGFSHVLSPVTLLK